MNFAIISLARYWFRLWSNFPLLVRFGKRGHQIWTPRSGARIYLLILKSRCKMRVEKLKEERTKLTNQTVALPTDLLRNSDGPGLSIHLMPDFAQGATHQGCPIPPTSLKIISMPSTARTASSLRKPNSVSCPRSNRTMVSLVRPQWAATSRWLNLRALRLAATASPISGCDLTE